jgi:hypothetical protein
MMALVALLGAVQIAAESGPVTSLVADDREVMWANASEIRAAPVGGGAPRTIVKLPTHRDDTVGYALLLTATHVVWTNGPIIWSAPRGGGKARQVGRSGHDFQTVGDIRTDGKRVYWRQGTRSGAVLSAPVQGGPTRRLARLDEAPSALAIHDGHIYWATVDSIYRMPIAGGRAARLMTDRVPPPLPDSEAARKPRAWTGIRDLAVGAGYVYFERQGGIGRFDLATTRVEPVLGLRSLAGLADDGFYQANADRIVRFPLGGGAATTLAAGLGSPGQVAVSGEWIYFHADGAIRRLPRPG